MKNAIGSGRMRPSSSRGAVRRNLRLIECRSDDDSLRGAFSDVTGNLHMLDAAELVEAADVLHVPIVRSAARAHHRRSDGRTVSEATKEVGREGD
jgi:hypothetical protein